MARVAGIQAVKNTSNIIPLAHAGVPVEGCIVKVEPINGSGDNGGETSQSSQATLPDRIGDYGGVNISVSVESTAKTGVEMEALAGVMGAALTVVDMCKGVDKGCVIGGVKVLGKKGGRSGGWGVWRDEDKENGRAQE